MTPERHKMLKRLEAVLRSEGTLEAIKMVQEDIKNELFRTPADATQKRELLYAEFLGFQRLDNRLGSMMNELKMLEKGQTK